MEPIGRKPWVDAAPILAALAAVIVASALYLKVQDRASTVCPVPAEEVRAL